MSRMHHLRTADNGEPTLWWSWQDLRGGVERKGPAPKGFCTHGRAWLRSLSNGIGIEWHLGSRRCHISLTFSTIGDEAIEVAVAIPFLFALYLFIDRAGWVKRLPGVRYVSGDYDSGEREIQIAVHHNTIWWSLWLNNSGMRSRNWRDGSFHIDDFILGRNQYSETKRQSYETYLIMPEGRYPATVELFTSIWKRPRWPWAMRVQRANVTVPGGVPVPGAGENSWDMDDDAIFEGVYPASTIEDGLAALRESVLRDRQHHAGEGWVPDAGWPAHCVRAVT